MSTVGADPEAFIVAEGKIRRPIPAHKVGLPYKQMPHALVDGFVLRDGYALELNPRFSPCRTNLVANFWHLLKQVRQHYTQQQRIITQSAMEVDLTELQDAPDDVAEFGCEGAWNAYSQTVVKPEIHGPSHPLRYTGGHIHVAHPAGASVPWATKLENVFLCIKLMDRYPGLISTFLTGSEWSWYRRQYYGQAGEFRLQEHPGTVAALEYRTPGSEVWSHPALTTLMLGLVRHIYENFESFAQSYSPTFEPQVQDAINAGMGDRSLLDLIPELPGWYSRKLLKRARPFFRKTMHQDLTPHITKHLNFSTMGKGWGSWCKEQGYIHYRNDYRGNDARVILTQGMNAFWGENL